MDESRAGTGPPQPSQTYNHWTVVNVVFHHLVDQGLHPVLGETGNPGAAAADLLRAFGITPLPGSTRRETENVQERLAALRAAVFDD